MPLLNFNLLWRGLKCPRVLKAWFDSSTFFNPKLVDLSDFQSSSYLFSPETPQDELPNLDLPFARYQEQVVKDLAASLFPGTRSPDAESVWQAEGETLREIGWIRAMDTPPKHSPELNKDNWHVVLPALSGIRNAMLLHYLIHASADYLFHDGPDSWLMVMVRPSSRVKDSYIAEAELTRWVFSQKGIEIKRCFLLAPHEDYERPNSGVDPRDYFQLQSLNHAIKHMRESFSSSLPRILSDASENKSCESPRTCALCRNASADLPEYHIRTLHRGGKAVELLENEGIVDLLQIEKASETARKELKDRHHIQLKAIRSSETYVDKPKLSTFLKTIQFPAVFLDFESTSEAIPPVQGTRPWEHVPFMYATHRLAHAEELDSEVQASSRVYVMDPAVSRQNQIRTLAESLLQDCRGSGSIVVYGAALETATLGRLATIFGDLSVELLALRDRIVDLQKPFVEFWYYHPKQHGKLSLKKILPLLSSHTHAGMVLQSGGEANLNYYFLSNPEARGQTLSARFDPATYRDWISNLSQYCAMDTFGLVQIVKELSRLAK